MQQISYLPRPTAGLSCAGHRVRQPVRSDYNTRSNPSDASSTADMIDASDGTGVQRERVAWHESGHALAFVLVAGRPPELVSVRPGRAFCGITVGPREKTWSGEFDPKLLSIDQPSDLRHAL